MFPNETEQKKCDKKSDNQATSNVNLWFSYIIMNTNNVSWSLTKIIFFPNSLEHTLVHPVHLFSLQYKNLETVGQQSSLHSAEANILLLLAVTLYLLEAGSHKISLLHLVLEATNFISTETKFFITTWYIKKKKNNTKTKH